MIALDQAIYTRLHGDATLLGLATSGVYQALAPQNTLPPYLLYCQYGAAAQPWTFSNPQPYTIYDYQFRAVHNGGPDVTVAETILARVKTLLNDYALVVAGYSTMVCRLNRIGAPMFPAADLVGGIPVNTLDHYYMIGLS